MRVAITGGCGYVGSNVAKLLLQRGDEVLLIDDMSNAKESRIGAIEKASGRRPRFEKIDLRNATVLRDALKGFDPQWVVHCAGVKSVRESKVDPLKYWNVNAGSTAALISAMPKNCRVVFSSSATVYAPSSEPVDEESPLGPASAYGTSKVACEWMLRQSVEAGLIRSCVALRYFNPLGADGSGLLGDDPVSEPENVMPMLMRASKEGVFSVFGGDYPTRDGSAVRDYIHIEDLARAHACVIDHGEDGGGWEVFNIGSSSGSTVIELLSAFNKASGRCVQAKMAPRRDGDSAISVANCGKIAKATGWSAKLSLLDMCESSLLGSEGRR